MNISEIITTLETTNDLQVINSALTNLCDIILSNSTISDDDKAKLARLRAQVNIILLH